MLIFRIPLIIRNIRKSVLVRHIFLINFFWARKNGEKVENDNPWNATTLEWNTPTPPPHGNFTEVPKVYRDAYEYSVPGAKEDYSPQWQEEA